MSVSISVLSAGRSGCDGLVCRMLSRCVILCLMFSGRSVLRVLILPLGMWSLSAVSMRLMRVWFAVWMLSGGGSWVIAVSMS